MRRASFRVDGTADGLAQPSAGCKPGPTILQLVPALNEGGVERGALEIGGAVLAAGGRALIATAGGHLEGRFTEKGGEIVHLPLDRKAPAVLWRNAKKLERLIRAEGVNLIHARSRAPAWSGLLAGRRTGVPFVTTYHGSYNEGAPFKRRYNSVMAKGNPTIAVSEFIAAMIHERHGLPPERIVTIPRGADLSLFTPENIASARIGALADAWGLAEVLTPIFMLPGRLTRWKGQEVFVDACGRLRREKGPCFLALMVGSESGGTRYTDALMTRIERAGCGDCVRLTGPCNDMPAAYSFADFVVSASTDPEAFGRVAVEAQAMGRPVIASDHGGARETVVHGETGWRVPPGDPQALAEAMNAALSLPKPERDAMAAAARARVEAHFSTERMCAATLDVYERVLGAAFPAR